MTGGFYDSIALFLRIFSSDFSLCIFLFVYIPGSFPPKHKKGNAHGTVHFFVMVIPFSLIAQFNIGGDYKELISNAIFYIALSLFFLLDL